MTRSAYFFIKKTCQVCGNEFKAARESAIYDKPKCRQKAKRDRDVLNERVRTVKELIVAIGMTDVSKEFKRYQLNSIRLVLEKALAESSVRKP